MVSDLYETMKSIPGGVIMLTVLVGILILAVLFIKYNVVILKALGKFNTWITGKITGKVGSKVKAVNKKFKRTADLYVNSPANAIYRYFDSILVNTGLQKRCNSRRLAFLPVYNVSYLYSCLHRGVQP